MRQRKTFLSWKTMSFMVFTLMIMISTFCMPSFVRAAQHNVIRVGWPIQAGLTEKKADGTYSGYTYDYLQELSQYTGWEYEYVEVPGEIDEQLTTLLDMLEKGEIDLLGAMRFSEATAKVYDFPQESYGSIYNTIAVLENNLEYDEYNLSKAEGIRIGIVKTATARNEKLAQYAQINGFIYKAVEYDTGAEAEAAARKGEVDAILVVDVGMSEGFRSIAHFAAEPFYFATTKGNDSIIMDLNRGILNIDDTNPTFTSEIYDKYFVPSKFELIITSSEETYLASKDKLQVLMMDGIGPISYLKDGEPTGFAVSVLENIAERTGLEIEYIIAKDMDEFTQMLIKKDVDLVLNVPNNYQIAKHLELTLTRPFLESSIGMAFGKDVNINETENLTLASVDGYDFGASDSTKIKRYDTVEEALNAVNKGEADIFYGMDYMISFYMNVNNYQNLNQLSRVQSLEGKYSFGIVHAQDLDLLSILNKGIKSLGDDEREDYLYQNAFVSPNYSWGDFIRMHPLEMMMLAILILFFIVIVFYRHYKMQMDVKHLVEVENSRYKMLAELTGEAIFEYNMLTDTMKITGKIVERFTKASEFKNYKKIMDAKAVDENSYARYLLDIIDHPVDMQKDVLVQLLDGTQRWFRVHVRVVYDASHRPISLIGRVRDVHEEHMEKEKLKINAQIDALTDIYNANSTRELIKEACLHAEPGSHALLIADLDHFKDINDQFGHYQGDKVLFECAAALKEVFAAHGLVGRLGGDEFLIFIEIKNEEQLQAMVQELFTKMTKLRIANKLQCAITISVGYTMIYEERDFRTLYKQADKALYEVKKMGRNGVSCYQSLEK